MLPQKYVVEGQSLKTGKWIELHCISPEKITKYEPQSFLWWKWVVPRQIYEDITEEQDDKLREEAQTEALKYITTIPTEYYSSIRIIRYYWFNFFTEYPYWCHVGPIWENGKWL